MGTLFRKELGVFFSSLTGLMVVLIFLLTTSIFLWVIPGGMNITESGYATLDPFFTMAPWLFLFLIPAVTMRLFSEENKSGTMEFLLTKPISEWGIVWAKYFSAIAIVLIALIPTLVYYFSIYRLGNPVGNIDMGGTWGSYIGLFFLAAIYTSVGLFCSSITSNQIVAFLLSTIVSFVIYYGFDAASQMFVVGGFENILSAMSIQSHYQSVSRGVLDLHDIVYFSGVSFLFIALTRIRLQSRTW